MGSECARCCCEHRQGFTSVTRSAPARQTKPTVWDAQVAVCRRLGLLSCGELGDRESLDESGHEHVTSSTIGPWTHFNPSLHLAARGRSSS
jgi:hypothetical protein